MAEHHSDNNSKTQLSNEEKLAHLIYLQTQYALEVGPIEWERLDLQQLVVSPAYWDFFQEVLKPAGR